jgi:hypothetical protein
LHVGALPKRGIWPVERRAMFRNPSMWEQDSDRDSPSGATGDTLVGIMTPEGMMR